MGVIEWSTILSSRNISCLFPIDSLYCFSFNPFLNSCDAYSGLCVYLLVCSSCTSFLPKNPPGSSDKSREDIHSLSLQSSAIQPQVKLFKELKRKVKRPNRTPNMMPSFPLGLPFLHFWLPLSWLSKNSFTLKHLKRLSQISIYVEGILDPMHSCL